MTGIHVFVDDARGWTDFPRCGYVIDAHGEVCSMPEPNRVHRVPDTSEAQAESRRRAGESETDQ